jgi:hypothetical protein
MNEDPRQRWGLTSGKDEPGKVLPNDSEAAKRRAVRERGLDKTIEDSFPTSDPPSSIPDPEVDDEAA